MNQEKSQIVIQVNSGTVETLLVDKRLECLLDLIEFVVKDVEATSSFPLNSDVPLEKQYDSDYGIEVSSYSPAIEVIDSDTYIEGSQTEEDQEKMMRVWLDDVRPLPTGLNYTHHAKTAQEAIDLLCTGRVSHISFDHDLGESSQTGYDVAKFIENKAIAGELFQFTWAIHSQNPVGRQNIFAAMTRADQAWAELDHLKV